MSRPKLAVLASGRGTNFSAIADACESGRVQAEVATVVTDQETAGVINLARSRGLPVEHVPYQGNREQHEGEVLKRVGGCDFLVLAGYMRVLSNELLRRFQDERGLSRVTNVHPALLPAFPGLKGYEQAFDHGCHLAGVTVHLVDEGVDTGPICAQEAFSIRQCRSAAEVEKLGLKLEHRLYPETLAWLVAGKYQADDREGRWHVRPS